MAMVLMTKLMMIALRLAEIRQLTELAALIPMEMVILMLILNGILLMELTHSRPIPLNGRMLMVMDMVIMQPDILPMIVQVNLEIHGKIVR